jgi:hypothetical protein
MSPLASSSVVPTQLPAATPDQRAKIEGAAHDFEA